MRRTIGAIVAMAILGFGATAASAATTVQEGSSGLSSVSIKLARSAASTAPKPTRSAPVVGPSVYWDGTNWDGCTDWYEASWGGYEFYCYVTMTGTLYGKVTVYGMYYWTGSGWARYGGYVYRWDYTPSWVFCWAPSFGGGCSYV